MNLLKFSPYLCLVYCFQMFSSRAGLDYIQEKSLKLSIDTSSFLWTWAHQLDRGPGLWTRTQTRRVKVNPLQNTSPLMFALSLSSNNLYRLTEVFITAPRIMWQRTLSSEKVINIMITCIFYILAAVCVFQLTWPEENNLDWKVLFYNPVKVGKLGTDVTLTDVKRVFYLWGASFPGCLGQKGPRCHQLKLLGGTKCWLVRGGWFIAVLV